MKLLLLRCPNCQDPLHPQDDDVVLPCTNCHMPILLNETGIHIAAVNYASIQSNASPDQLAWRPYWVTYGNVNITSRQTQGTNRQALQDSQDLWNPPRNFYIPAWEMPIAQVRQIGSQLIHQQPQLTAGDRPNGVQFPAANITAADALQLLEMIVLHIEAKRKDWLKDLKFTIEAPEPELWVIPK